MIRKYITLKPTSKAILLEASKKFQLSARSYLKIIKIARSIADLEQDSDIEDQHVAEALQYRPKIVA